MTTLEALYQAWSVTAGSVLEYQCQASLNLYKTPALDSLVTQAAAGRHLRPLEVHRDDHGADAGAVYVRLCEDNYPGWIDAADLALLVPAANSYRATVYSRAAIEARLPAVIAFTRQAQAQSNTYLWGGTVGPNFDCSGLMQTAFAAAGIWLPRDSYQQEAFTAAVSWDRMQPGDLVFFGTPSRTNHVGLYLGAGSYIHSSGVDQGRNGIGLDSLSDLNDPISQVYHRQRRRAGRVISSYSPDMPLVWG